MKTLSATHSFNGKDYNVYKDTALNLEFIFIDGEEGKFHSLLKTYGNTDNFPANTYLTGIYFKEGTRNTAPDYENSNILANCITK